MPIQSDYADGGQAIAALGGFGADINPKYVRAMAGLYIGTTADIEVMFPDGTTTTFLQVQQGSILPIQIRQLVAAGAGFATDFIVMTTNRES
jgi:hypothetical protein